MKSNKKLFPIFSKRPNLTYLDTASSAQKSSKVINSITSYYEEDYSNASRGACPLAEGTTSLVEKVRLQTANFINAKSSSEIVFTKSATESMNMLASSLELFLKEGDEIIIADTEHHSNILPWFSIAKRKNLKLKIFKMEEDGSLDIEKFKNFLTTRTKLVSISPLSNVLGTLLPVSEIIQAVKSKTNALIHLDLCQYIVHRPTDMQKWDCDFASFSAHKLYGPTGVGIFYSKKCHHEELTPYQLGGGTVQSVNLEKDLVKLNRFPISFEAGTLPIAQIIGLGSAIEFMEEVGYSNIISHDKEMLEYAVSKLSNINYLDILGVSKENIKNRSSIISFTIKNMSAFDFAVLMGKNDICLRAGTSCADLLHQKLGITHSFRISFGIYSEKTDVDKFIEKMDRVVSKLL